ncbi:MAG: two-component sensor histidine kinase, partial [Thiothrix nivea]
MMGSLRSRQLVSGFTIIVVGILILGLLLSFNLHQRKTDAVATEIENTFYNLLGFLQYNNGIFTINAGSKEVFDFIASRKLLTHDKERFAYIWSMNEQKIV